MTSKTIISFLRVLRLLRTELDQVRSGKKAQKSLTDRNIYLFRNFCAFLLVSLFYLSRPFTTSQLILAKNASMYLARSLGA